ncbi:MAG: YchJ family metal-binding protein [Cyanobacteria bacterium J06621_11]
MAEKSGLKYCYCGSQRPAVRCCEPYLTGKKTAPTAEALMRSRYSAFCQGNVDYLVRTHHREYGGGDEQKGLRKSLERNVVQTQWTHLLIVRTQKGQKKDKTGTVEFVAAYRSAQGLGVLATAGKTTAGKTAGKIDQLHERSKFVREQGEWFYTEGDRLPDYVPKRSQPCWCGSGKPFKHCHA